MYSLLPSYLAVESVVESRTQNQYLFNYYEFLCKKLNYQHESPASEQMSDLERATFHMRRLSILPVAC